MLNNLPSQNKRRTKFSQKRLREVLSEIPEETLAFRNLPSYIALLNPAYEFANHTLLVSRYLMAVESGEITRLIISMPPRHSKTMTVSEYFPAWYMGRNPDAQVIFATYSYERSGDVGRKVRDQMIDPMFNKIFNCGLKTTAKGQNRFITTKEGIYHATGIHGVIVGRGANLFIIDDPIKSREDAESDTKRRKLHEWFRAVAYTRLQPQNAIIILNTRWHYDDLSGFAMEELEHENWSHLSLPAICDDHYDPVNRNIGEALWPSRYPIERLKAIKATVGTREWASQYQQSPIESGLGVVNINDFKKYDYTELKPILTAIIMRGEVPKMPFGIVKIVQSWDTANKEAQMNDPSGCTTWGVTKERDAYLLGTVNKRMAYPKLKRKVISEWERFMKFNVGTIPVIIEDKASGQSLIQDLKGSKIPVIKAIPNANKRIRMDSNSAMIEAGKVYLPDETMEWVVDYETEMARFPHWKFDNLADSTSQFLEWITRARIKRKRPIRFWK